MPVTQSRPQFHSLDLLRGVASAAVLIWHIGPARGIVFNAGYLAVDLFFLISGFIVALAYEDKLRTNLSFFGFARIRLIRLYPVYMIGSMIGLFAVAISILLSGFAFYKFKPILISLVAAFFVLPVPRDEHTASYLLNMPAWSLALELAINFIYAAMLPKLSNRVLITVTAISAAGLLACAFGFGSVDFGAATWRIILAAPRVGLAFSLGVLFFRWRTVGRLPSVRLHWAIPSLLFLAVVAVPIVSSLRSLFDVFAIVVLFPLIFLAAVDACMPAVAVKMASLSAEFSYPLYMLHVPIIMLAEVCIAHSLIGTKPAFWSAAIVSFVLSVVIARQIDPPVRRFLNKRLPA